MQLKEYQDRAVNDKESRHAQPGRGDRKAVRPGKPQRNFTDSAKKNPPPWRFSPGGGYPRYILQAARLLFCLFFINLFINKRL